MSKSYVSKSYDTLSAEEFLDKLYADLHSSKYVKEDPINALMLFSAAVKQKAPQITKTPKSVNTTCELEISTLIKKYISNTYKHTALGTANTNILFKKTYDSAQQIITEGKLDIIRNIYLQYGFDANGNAPPTSTLFDRTDGTGIDNTMFLIKLQLVNILVSQSNPPAEDCMHKYKKRFAELVGLLKPKTVKSRTVSYGGRRTYRHRRRGTYRRKQRKTKKT
jgi:hypothetical protein